MGAYDDSVVNSTIFPSLTAILADPYKQGGLQIAGTFASMGIAIVAAIVTGVVLKFVYSFHPADFFRDHIYFE